VKIEGKISSDLDEMDIHLVKTPKLIRMVKEIAPDSFLVGFKLLVGSDAQKLLEAMKMQMEKASTDMVVGNDLRDMKANDHALTILDKQGGIWEYKSKRGDILAEYLVNTIEYMHYV